MSRRDGGGALTCLLALLSLLVFAAGAFALYHVMTAPAPETDQAVEADALSPKSFSEYDWDELSQVAQMISEAPSDEDILTITTADLEGLVELPPAPETPAGEDTNTKTEE